jgi:hypothetical protein
MAPNTSSETGSSWSTTTPDRPAAVDAAARYASEGAAALLPGGATAGPPAGATQAGLQSVARHISPGTSSAGDAIVMDPAAKLRSAAGDAPAKRASQRSAHRT